MTSRACSEAVPGARAVAAEVMKVVVVVAVLFLGGSAAAQTSQSAKSRGPIANTPDQTIKGSAMAVEGDLLTVNGTAVRLMGIDAPDPGQKCKNRYGHELDCFKVATAVLANMVKGEEVTCTVTEQDRTGEKKGECRVRGVDLGAAMVARGWAFQYASLSPAYQKGEAYAQSKRLGLWAGQVERPWQWRSRQIRQNAK